MAKKIQCHHGIVVLVLIVAALLWMHPVSAVAWLTEVDLDETGAATAVGSAGEIFVGGRFVDHGLPQGLSVGRLDPASGEFVWLSKLPAVSGSGPWTLSQVAVDPTGDVLAAGNLDSGPAVVKVSGFDGTELWRSVIAGNFVSADRVHAAAVNSSGDIFAVLGVLLVKLDGATGTEMWRVSDTGVSAHALSLDTSGNVLIAGGVFNGVVSGEGDWDFGVAKVSGATGAINWQRSLSGPGTAPKFEEAHAVTVDGAGDVVAAGVLWNNDPFDTAFTVVKLSGATGATLWLRQIEGSGGGYDEANAVAIDSLGDVFAGGQLDQTASNWDFSVVKLDGASGATEWEQNIDGGGSGGLPPDTLDNVRGIAVSGTDVVAVGTLQNPDTSGDFTAVMLSGTTGAELWRQEGHGRASFGQDAATQIKVLDASGNVVVNGYFANRNDQGAVLRLIAQGGANGIRGRRLIIKDRDGDASRRRLTLILKDHGFFTPPPESANDPRLVGAAIRVWNDTTGEQQTILLPAGGWEGLGNPAGIGGYKYIDKIFSLGPCKKAIAKDRRLVKAVCAGSGLTFTLDESSQGKLFAAFDLGSARSCTAFGGQSVVKDIQAAAGTGDSGLFKAGSTLPPGSCKPVVP